jgi:neuron navigator 2
MRQTIELLRKQSIQAGLTSAHMQSMGVPSNVNGAKANGSPTKGSTATNGQQQQQENGNGNMQRHHSTDSMCSINSNGSNGSSQDKKKKKGWVSNQANQFSFDRH